MFEKADIFGSVFCLVFLVASPALAKRSGGFGGGGLAKPKSPPKTTQTSPDKTDSTTGSDDKIPYTNLPAGKKTAAGGKAAATGPMAGRSNFSGFSISPFSGNFWMWMFLMNSFGHSQPAAAQTGKSGDSSGSQAQDSENQEALYTPSVSEYWAADPFTNTVSTLLLVAVVAVPVWFIWRWRKRMAALR